MSNKNKLFAGIAVLAAGAAVFYFTRPAPSADVVAAPNQVVEHSAAAVPAPFVGPRTKPEAMAALMALPELQAWSEYIKLSSKGSSHGALIEYGPTPKTIGAKRYWQLSYVENTPDSAHRWESFLVGENNPEILVEDAESDQPISLAQWRKEKQPLARIGG
ncbi:MAG: hypothetical protein V4484_11580 [Pseudomonadota bacterium]